MDLYRRHVVCPPPFQALRRFCQASRPSCSFLPDRTIPLFRRQMASRLRGMYHRRDEGLWCKFAAWSSALLCAHLFVKPPALRTRCRAQLGPERPNDPGRLARSYPAPGSWACPSHFPEGTREMALIRKAARLSNLQEGHLRIQE
jgi:hypothetical protein